MANMTSAELARIMASRGPQSKLRAKRFTGKRSLAKTQALAELMWHGPECITLQLSRKAMGKPRMTQRDKWAKRDCVMAYREFADALRMVAGANLPPASRVKMLDVHASFATADASLWGKPYQQKPDADNIVKACTDPLWKDDQKLGELRVRRTWMARDLVTIYIWTTPALGE
jgi:Holliday junction resolvase RusA-like endonuclease